MKTMNLFSVLAASLIGVCLVSPALAQSPPPEKSTRSKPSAETTKSTQTRRSEPAPVRSAAARDDMTLDAITIEGEIDVPQVLFITARDQFRNTDFLHRLFLANVQAIGQDAARRKGLGWTHQGETIPWKPSVR